ncbi:hypothetical protein B0T16DRAFT_141945 [Cercophora newfieldiana]|uniref:Uncharacterized protein n=1 Tax=Cercophora newfieldiana TaxID=92897 RepID=A0AA39Y3V8_9PEZI|nr:hypothetical protein B0T16DRAFT_141945 [Cercophora newfieldiana]
MVPDTGYSYSQSCDVFLRLFRLDSFGKVSTHELEALIRQKVPAGVRGEKRLCAHTENLCETMAGGGEDDIPSMVCRMEGWRDDLVAYGYKVTSMARVFQARHWELALENPEKGPSLDCARRAMERALGVAIPPPPPPPPPPPSPPRPRPVIIVISDDEESEPWPVPGVGTKAGPEPASNCREGSRLEVGRLGEPCERHEAPASPGHLIQSRPTPQRVGSGIVPTKIYSPFSVPKFLGTPEEVAPRPRLAPSVPIPPSVSRTSENQPTKKSPDQLRTKVGTSKSQAYSPFSVGKIWGVKMENEEPKEASTRARTAPSASLAGENQTTEASRGRSQPDVAHRGRTASPRGQGHGYRSRSPLQDRGNKPKVESRRNKAGNQVPVQYPRELNYDDEDDEGDQSAPTPRREATERQRPTNILFSSKRQDEGRLSYHDVDNDEDDDLAIAEPTPDTKHLHSRGESESPVFIRSQKATGQRSHGRNKVEMKGPRSEPKSDKTSPLITMSISGEIAIGLPDHSRQTENFHQKENLRQAEQSRQTAKSSASKSGPTAKVTRPQQQNFADPFIFGKATNKKGKKSRQVEQTLQTEQPLTRTFGPATNQMSFAMPPQQSEDPFANNAITVGHPQHQSFTGPATYSSATLHPDRQKRIESNSTPEKPQ